MLFKNLKSGNFVEVKDASTIEMMEASPNYEKAAVQTPVLTSEAPKQTKKPAKGGKEKTAE